MILENLSAPMDLISWHLQPTCHPPVQAGLVFFSQKLFDSSQQSALKDTIYNVGGKKCCQLTDQVKLKEWARLPIGTFVSETAFSFLLL